MNIGKETHNLKWLNFDGLSDQQDRLAKRESPDMDKIILIRLQMLAEAYDAMPPTFDIARAQRTAKGNIDQIKTARNVLRGTRIVKKLLQEKTQ